MTDLELAAAYKQTTALVEQARAVSGEEQQVGIAVARQAVALKRELEQWIVQRAIRATRA